MTQPQAVPARAARSRLLVLLPAGAAAFMLSAYVFAPSSDGAVVEAVTPKRSQPPPAPPLGDLQTVDLAATLPQPRLDAEARSNPFGALNLQPPGMGVLGQPKQEKPAAPPAPKPAATPAPEPPPPMAPPLPFTAIGSIEGPDVTSGQLLAFLQQQDKLLVVRKGETIGQFYRVEAVTPDKVEFTYLPLNQRQALALTPRPQ